MHTENPGNIWYSSNGLAAAKKSDLYEGCGSPITAAAAIDGWISGLFHRVSLLNPNLTGAAYGLYQDGSGCWVVGIGLLPGKASNWDRPVRFPGPGSRIFMNTLTPGEWPDPLANCPDYTYPSGFPITIEFGFGKSPIVRRGLLRHDGEVLPVCLVYRDNYQNSDLNAQAWGRSVLNGFGAAAMIPRRALEPGKYDVAMETSRGGYEWSFWIIRRSSDQ